MSKVLNKMVKRAVNSSLINGISIGNKNVVSSHLQFADDTIFFYLSDDNVLYHYKCILHCFILMIGLEINYEKSASVLVISLINFCYL